VPKPSDNVLRLKMRSGHTRPICNIDQHNKTNSVFSRIYLVPRASSALFDDDEVKCSLNLLKQTIAWNWTGPLKILQYRYPYLDRYAKQLKYTAYVPARASYCKTGKLAKKSWRIVVICQIRQSFLLYGMYNS